MFVPGMLHGALVLTEHPRARITAIRTAAANAMPGVVRTFTASDVPGGRGTGLNLPDLPVFVAVGETTCCVGDFLAMVVADTAFHARQAAEKVEVDYEVLEPITDPFAALEPGAIQVHSAETVYPASNLIDTTAFSRGDVNAALAASAHVIEETFVTQPVEPAFLEPEACLALPQGNGIKVHTESQGSIFDQRQIARVLNLPPEEVEIALAASGGAFGAKEELSIQAQTAVAAYLLGRPVKTVLTREQSTQHHVKRHPMTLKYTSAPMPTGICSRCGPGSSAMPAATQAPAANACCARRAIRAVRTACPTSTSSPRPSTRTIPPAERCAASAATRRSSPWKA